ncbi:MAG: restriction endonuclease [Rhodoferax sp.]|uniref:restriction endonuclease n=1 Tax=Rhodoferax sp. TaxID=50421 RepID=UPI0032673972
MPKPRSSRSQKRGIAQLLEKGATALVLGIAMLLSPTFLGSSPIMKALATGLRTPAWLAIGIGVLFIGAYMVFKRKADAAATPDALPATANPNYRPTKPRKPPTAVPPTATARVEPSMLTPPAPTPATSWSPSVFAAIEWRRFEAVCEALFTQAGLTSRAQSHGADGGVDIWLYSRNAETPVAVVQCKHWQGKPVGVKEVREFFGVMASHKLQRGVYATTSSYTADALAFAQSNGITAMDGPALLDLIAKRTPEQQQALLAVAYEGEYWKPTCASCGTKMLERTPAKGGAPFWGCSNYPRCKCRLAMLAAR